MTDTIKLYHVYSKLPVYEIKGIQCHDIHISWFVKDRVEPPAPYEILINHYDPQAGHVIHPQNAVKELFTIEEADAFSAYLTRSKIDATPIIKAAELPIEMNRAGFLEFAVGEASGFYRASEEDDYDLPFTVWGYFDAKDQYVGAWSEKVTNPEIDRTQKMLEQAIALGLRKKAKPEALRAIAQQLVEKGYHVTIGK
ncbi:MAG: hypothetical protein HY862_15380 [Chloroflexi bacterium]|nr:hypothetical protein [Chloroflexota bacterium]